MARASLPIGNGFYGGDSLPVSAQSCINLFVKASQAPALADLVPTGTPGTTFLASSGTLSTDANRGAWTFNEVPYFVNGNQLCRLESDLSTMTELGEIPGSGRVVMVDNGAQMCILVPGGSSTGYIFTEDPDTLVEITDPDFRANGNPQHVVFVDSYFVFITDSKRFIVSGLNDGLTYNALDFGSAEADPDKIVSAVVHKNQLFIAGSQTIEAFQNIGGGDFPFQRNGVFLNYGVAGQHTLVPTGDSFFFIGSGKNGDVSIRKWDGGEAPRASTDAVDSLLKKFTPQEISESFAYAYTSEGRDFVCFALPTTTIVLEEGTGLWHERRSTLRSPVVGQFIETRSRVNSLVVAYGKFLVGDSQDGRVGEYTKEDYGEYGGDIHRTLTLQPLHNTGAPFFIASLELTVESGVGNDKVPDPSITLFMSKDGGKTFDGGKSRKIGKKGEYTRRVIWRRLGRVPRFVVFKFAMSDQVKPVIIQLLADIQGGS